MVTLLEAAREYIQEGRNPFPVRDKKPVVSSWRRFEREAPTDAEIEEWWGGPAPADMAIPTVGLCVVDVDAAEPWHALGALMDRLRVDLPSTRVVRTPRGGLHVYFLSPGGVRNSSGKLAPSVDIRADGGYVVAPPSPGYEIVANDPIANAPVELLRAAEARKQQIPRAAAADVKKAMREEFPDLDVELLEAACSVAGAPVGRRNDELNRQAFTQARRKEVTPLGLGKVFLRASQLCGLSAAEASATLRSAIEGALRQLPARRLTDLGNAERLVDTHGEFLRFSDSFGWLGWRGTHWTKMHSPLWLAGAVAREMTEKGKDDGNEDLRKWGRKSETAKALSACIFVAKHHPEIQIEANQLDRDPLLLSTPTGIVDLRTGALRDSDPRDLCTRVTNVGYDPKAKAPRFVRFLEEIFPDVDVREHVRRWCGYCATGLTKAQLIHLWHGEGANGKSVMLRVVSWVLGSYAQLAAPELLVEKAHHTHPTERAELRGARFVHTAETGEGRRWDMSTVKQLTGGDPIRARFMRQDFFEFLPTWSIVVATNHRPRIVGYDHADWRRILVIPFEQTFDPGDPDLLDELLDEAPGILRWVVEGARDYLREGDLLVPDRVRLEVERYRTEQDVIGAFLRENTYAEVDGFVVRSEIWRRYRDWLTETGEYKHGRQAFFRLIGDRWGEVVKRSDGARGWPGQALVSRVRGKPA